MTNIVRFMPLACVLTLATGCSGATQATKQPSPTVTSSSTTTAKPAVHTAIRSLPPVAKLTAACPLLSSAELKTLLGGGASKTKVTAKEAKPPTAHTHMCEYGSRGKNAFALLVDGVAQKGLTPKAEIDAIVKSHRHDKTKIRNVTGVGEVASFLTFKDGVSELVGSKRSYGQVRLVILNAPKVVPERKFVDVGKLVIGRI